MIVNVEFLESSLIRDKQKTYKEIISLLKTSNVKDEREDTKSEINILLEIFEVYKNNTNKIMTELNDENSRLRNEIMRIYSYFGLLIERLQSINQSKQKQHNRADMNCHYETSPNMPTNLDEYVDQLRLRTTLILEEVNKLREECMFGEKVNLIRKMKRESHIQRNAKNIGIGDKKLSSSSILPQVNNIQIQRWMPDYLVKHCQQCTKKFGMFLGKYHCYICGDIFCSTCLINEILHPFKEKVRTCLNCNFQMKTNIQQAAGDKDNFNLV